MSRTPRTLAECRFTAGYPIAHYRAPWRLADFGWAIVCVAACVAVGALLAWRM
jgi:hypothetical protein